MSFTTSLCMLLLLLCITLVIAPPPDHAKRDKPDNVKTPPGQSGDHGPPDVKGRALGFLKKYGYMGRKNPNPSWRNKTDDEVLPDALKMYQERMGLEVTGVLTEETIEMMGSDRCGVEDILSLRDMTRKRRRKRFALQGFRWRDNNIRYRINNFTPDLDQSTVERVIGRALQYWSDVTPLTFEKVSSQGTADIEILFAARDHGDGEPFDGPSGTLAHAFFPNSGGDAHFDEDERFTDQTNSGINLLFVAVHEFGHSLGLAHSTERSAIMFPTYSGFLPNLRLDADDINGIQMLYGAATPPPPTTPRPTVTPSPEAEAFCTDGTVDAIDTFNNNVYAFQGTKYSLLDINTGIVAGYPKTISSDWPGGITRVDAALQSPPDNGIFLFQGHQVWLYTEGAGGSIELTPGYPKNISERFIDLPDDIDISFFWSGNGRPYIFKGDNYYRLSLDGTRVDPEYPRLSEFWKLPDEPLSAAFMAPNRRTYFFYGDQFIRYNDFDMQVESGYPLAIRDGWFGCGQNPQMEGREDADQFPGVTPQPPVSTAPPLATSTLLIVMFMCLLFLL